MSLVLQDLLCCPHDFASPLTDEGDALVCPRCHTRYQVRDGIVSFLDAQKLSEELDRERRYRDQESSWYETMYEGYTNAVEVPTTVNRIGKPTGPILDAGCGTGRITEALVKLGQPIIAVDYSDACLRMMIERTAGFPVLAVQSDLRSLPIRSGVMTATTCIEVYGHLREDDRKRVLADLSRVMTPNAPLSISSYNYNLIFRAWKLLGNQGAKEGEHVLGNDYYYVRQRKDEFRRELEAVFDVEEIVGIRNIPARSLASALSKARLPKAGDRLLDFMVERGHKADFLLERTPIGSAVGFFLLAKACRRRD